MNRARLLAELTRAGPEDVVLLERRGDDYRWSRLEAGAVPDLARERRGDAEPDAWIFYSGPWPSGQPEDLPRFLEDLLAEMESMCGGADRCRWPLDDPYPAWH